MRTYFFEIVAKGSYSATGDEFGAIAEKIHKQTDDASPSVSNCVLRIAFDRRSGSFETAVRSAIADIALAGLEVERLEMCSDDITQTLVPAAEEV